MLNASLILSNSLFLMLLNPHSTKPILLYAYVPVNTELVRLKKALKRKSIYQGGRNENDNLAKRDPHPFSPHCFLCSKLYSMLKQIDIMALEY